MPSPLSSERLLPGDEQSFGELLTIYREAIDASGQKSPTVLRAMLDSPDYRFVVYRMEGRVVGFAIVYVSSDSSVALLEYLAVDASRRDQGIGGRLFRDTVAMLAHDGKSIPLLVEVDAVGLPDAEQALRRRRQAFYGRLGCRRVDGLKYIIPLATDPPPPATDLLVHSAGVSLPYDVLAWWLSVIYARVYGQQGDDPRLATMVGSLTGVVPLTLVPESPQGADRSISSA
jgi:ribosomal protein S18 acetylase RimI-like enzyme